MANYASTGRSSHHTLAANTVDVVTLVRPYRKIEVINDDPANALYITVGKAATPAPTIAGDGSLYIGPGAARTLDDSDGETPADTVKLISAGAAAYHVTGS